jgi:hypothetical protein
VNTRYIIFSLIIFAFYNAINAQSFDFSDKKANSIPEFKLFVLGDFFHPDIDTVELKIFKYLYKNANTKVLLIDCSFVHEYYLYKYLKSARNISVSNLSLFFKIFYVFIPIFTNIPPKRGLI